MNGTYYIVRMAIVSDIFGVTLHKYKNEIVRALCKFKFLFNMKYVIVMCKCL